jgi:glycosyltransferase involved in cell wall biosynthesis
MKILLLSFGQSEYVLNLYLGLLKNKMKDLSVHIILLYQTETSNIITLKKLNNPQILLKKMPRLRSMKNFSSMYEIYQKIKSINPDKIHILCPYLWFFLFIPLRNKMNIISTVHDVNPHLGENKIMGNIDNIIINCISRQIIVHGNRLKEEYAKKYKYNKQIFVILHGVFQSKKPQKAHKKTSNEILFFGRIKKYKGLEYLIKAEPLIDKKIKNFKIVIAGGGEDFKQCEKLIINKKNFVVFNKQISNAFRSKLFEKCGIVVLPYVEASQSGVIPIAYDFKKPVISTNVGALNDVVIDGKTGFLIEPKDVEALAEKIIWMLQHPKERRQMGINGYNFSKKELSWDKIAKKTIDVYKNETLN